MKLISLNIWGGAVHDALLDFIREEMPTTDIFCFQEVFRSSEDAVFDDDGSRSNIFGDLVAVLPGYRVHFVPTQDIYAYDNKTDLKISVGQATFLAPRIALRAEGSVFLHRDRNTMVGDDITTLPTSGEYIRIVTRGTPYTIVNVYGLPQPGDKRDTPERLEQSKRLAEFLGKEDGKIIVCGDFNLAPETESVRIIEKSLRNLISEYRTETTRSALHDAKYPENERQHFADYIFVSPDIRVASFEVPRIAVSDHLPMILEFA